MTNKQVQIFYNFFSNRQQQIANLYLSCYNAKQVANILNIAISYVYQVVRKMRRVYKHIQAIYNI